MLVHGIFINAIWCVYTNNYSNNLNTMLVLYTLLVLKVTLIIILLYSIAITALHCRHTILWPYTSVQYALIFVISHLQIAFVHRIKMLFASFLSTLLFDNFLRIVIIVLLYWLLNCTLYVNLNSIDVKTTFHNWTIKGKSLLGTHRRDFFNWRNGQKVLIASLFWKYSEHITKRNHNFEYFCSLHCFTCKNSNLIDKNFWMQRIYRQFHATDEKLCFKIKSKLLTIYFMFYCSASSLSISFTLLLMFSTRFCL